MKIPPPLNETELLNRTRIIAGCTLGELAGHYQIELPINLTRAKGWVGQLIERILGTTAGSKAAPDFEHLGIELKTLPINAEGCPQETTYVSTVPLVKVAHTPWRHSNVYKKLARVLWVPVEADVTLPIPKRRVGNAVLWSPNEKEEFMLRQDWEELMEKICLGQVETITASQGTYLHIRPKAANAKAKRLGVGSEGENIQTLPRGFYLRTDFTQQILKNYYRN